MIKFASSDSVIWNRDQFVIDLAHAMAQSAPRIDIGTQGEGPCARSLGLYDLLDQLCEKFNYPAGNIYLVSCNLAESHDRYNVVINPQAIYLRSAQQYTPPSSVKQIQKHFGHFIGHGNYPRLYLGSYLHNRYSEQTLRTYHTIVTDDYHRPFVGVEDMLFHGCDFDQVQTALDLLQQAPITLDQIDQYPILNPTTLNITKVYPEFFVEIVNLTYWSGNTFYIDEKIWRPMLMRTPFVVHGPQHFLSRLRGLGFKTFDTWWDEGYSEDSPDLQLTGITQIIDQLALKTLPELEAMYADMQSVLNHNYDLMKRIQRHELHA